MPGAERGRRQEDREGAGRVLDEDVAIGQRPVQELLGVALVDVDVAEARRAEEAAVGHGAGGEVDRDRDERGAQRRFHGYRPACSAVAEAAGPAEAEAAGPAAVAAGAPAAEAAAAGSW